MRPHKQRDFYQYCQLSIFAPSPAILCVWPICVPFIMVHKFWLSFSYFMPSFFATLMSPLFSLSNLINFNRVFVILIAVHSSVHSGPEFQACFCSKLFPFLIFVLYVHRPSAKHGQVATLIRLSRGTFSYSLIHFLSFRLCSCILALELLRTSTTQKGVQSGHFLLVDG